MGEEDFMKFNLYSGLFVAALTCPFVHAHTTKAVANVPFEFKVGETLMPAGHYEIDESRDLLTVFQSKDRLTVMRLTIPDSRSTASPDAKLQFTRYGDEYYLTSVWDAGGKDGRTLLPSKEERALAKRARSAETARISMQPASR
jgi:hypothetical protein